MYVMRRFLSLKSSAAMALPIGQGLLLRGFNEHVFKTSRLRSESAREGLLFPQQPADLLSRRGRILDDDDTIVLADLVRPSGTTQDVGGSTNVGDLHKER